MSKAKGCGIAVMATVLACGVGGWGIYRLGGASDRKALDAQLTRAQSYGLPAQMADLWPAPKDPARNAAPIYTALSRSRGIGQDRSAVEKIGYPENADEIKAIETALASDGGDLAKFEAAASLPECSFQRKPSIDVLLPEYATMKPGVAVLAGRARLEAAKGDPLKAMRTLDEAAHVSVHCGQEPLLIAKLVQIATEAIVLRAAQEVLSDNGHRADVREAARKVLADLGPDPNLKDGLKGEWSFQREAPKAIDSGKISMDEFVKMSDAGESDGQNRFGSAVFAFTMKTPAGRARQELTAARLFLDYYHAMPDDPTKVDQARTASKDLDDTLAKGGMDTTLAKILTPVFSQANDAVAKAIVQRRLFKALLNALDSSRRLSAVPLEGKEAIDPFSKAPYRFRATSKEIRIWSVGPDGLDNDGLLKRTDDAEDITVMWPYPKQRPKER